MQACNTPDTMIESTKRLGISGERGRLLYGGGRVYLGSLDDSVSRHPWNGYQPSLDYLNKRLVDSVLFGAPISVRIGNLLFQDEYITALLHPKTSPLVELAKVGFVQFQMNSDSINESIGERVRSKTQSAVAMKEKHYWYHGSSSYNALATLDRVLVPGLGKIRYSSSFNGYFRAIMRESSGTATPAFRQVYDTWSKRPASGPDGRTRNHFELDAIRLLNGDPNQVREAMWVANAANHYAYSLQFIDQGGDAPMVETTQFDRHAEMCATRHALPTELAQELLAKANLTDPINLALSYISVPPEAYDPANAVILANLARQSPPGEDAPFDEKLWTQFIIAKTSLITTICDYLTNPQSKEVENVRTHALIYNDVLGQAFGRAPNRSIGFYLRILARRSVRGGPEAVVQQTAQTLGSAAFGDVIGFTLGVALAIANVPLIRSLASLSRLHASPDNPVEIGEDGEDPAKTAERLASSAFLRYGSYVGVRTINREKATGFRDTLTPD